MSPAKKSKAKAKRPAAKKPRKKFRAKKAPKKAPRKSSAKKTPAKKGLKGQGETRPSPPGQGFRSVDPDLKRRIRTSLEDDKAEDIVTINRWMGVSLQLMQTR